MRAVGLITEYNPFHNGHCYHIEQAKRLTDADCVVAVMSGNFVQRGEPAILDKWHRTKEALKGGVNLVIELPVALTVEPANRFAGGALTLLHALHVDSVVFGSEHPDWNFSKLVAAEDNFQKQSFEKFNATYATQFNEQLKKQTGYTLTEPNDILAFSYYKENFNRQLKLNLYPIKRIGGAYHDPSLTSRLSSATAIRNAIKEKKDVSKYVPNQTALDLRQVSQVPTFDALYPLLRNQLIQTPVQQLSKVYSMSEGLEYRLKEAAENNLDFAGYLKAIKTKRYTYAHLLRVSFYTILGAAKSEVATVVQHPYLRVLGFDRIGQQYLHQIKKSVELPLINRVDRDLRQGLLNLDYRVGKLYQTFTPDEQDVTRSPIIVGLSRKKR